MDTQQKLRLVIGLQFLIIALLVGRIIWEEMRGVEKQVRPEDALFSPDLNNFNPLRSTGLLGTNTINMNTREIDTAEARDLTRRYKNVLNRIRIGQGDNARQVLEFLHGNFAADTATRRVSYRFEKKYIEDLISQRDADFLMVFPAYRKNGDYSYVLAAGDADFNPSGEVTEIRLITERQTPRPFDRSTTAQVMYDEIFICPPPVGCKGF